MLAIFAMPGVDRCGWLDARCMDDAWVCSRWIPEGEFVPSVFIMLEWNQGVSKECNSPTNWYLQLSTRLRKVYGGELSFTKRLVPLLPQKISRTDNSSPGGL